MTLPLIVCEGPGSLDQKRWPNTGPLFNAEKENR